MPEIIFLWVNYFISILRDILRGPKLFWPLNCPYVVRDNFRDKKAGAPSKYPEKRPIN
jgi:hypothetical protein